MDFPQQRGTHFPENADATDALESAIPSSYRCPVLGQPHGHAGVVRDAMVSDWHRDVSPLIFMCCF